MKRLSGVLLAAGLMLVISAFSGPIGKILGLAVPLGILAGLWGLGAGAAAGTVFLAAWAGLFQPAYPEWLAVLGPVALGLVCGECLYRRKPAGWAIVLGAGVLALSLAGWVPALAEQWREWREGVMAGVRATLDLYEASGLLETGAQPGLGAEELRRAAEGLAQHLSRLFPAAVAWQLLAVAAAVHFLVRWAVGRWKAVPALPSFTRWQVPWPLTWGVIIGLAALLVGDWQNSELAAILGINIVVGYLPLALANGLAVLVCLYRYLVLPPVIKAMGILPLVLYPPLGILVMGALGLFDPLVNFRRLIGQGGERR